MTLIPQLERDLHRAAQARLKPAAETKAPPPRRRRIRPLYVGQLAAVALALAVAGVFIGTRSHHATRAGAPAAMRIVLVPALPGSGYQSVIVSDPGLARAAAVLDTRLRAVLPGAHAVRDHEAIVVTVAHPSASARALVLLLAGRGELSAYDWEADALTPTGRPVASRLPNDARALTISQGTGVSAPGSADAGALTRRAAVALAARHPGAIVLAAVPDRFGAVPALPRYFVLRRAPFLAGSAIAGARATTDASGAAAVTITLTAAGGRALHAGTMAVARRGDLVSGLGQRLNQHIALALDDQLVTVPAIDFSMFPDGLSGSSSMEIVGGLTPQTARALAAMLRTGPMPFGLLVANYGSETK